MKSEQSGLKSGSGEIKIFPETIDDLWHLRHLVTAGDLVYATTFRSLESATDKLRPEKAEKKPRVRKPTKPTLASKKKRMDLKKKRSNIKKMRRIDIRAEL